jgi:hypothetical protein
MSLRDIAGRLVIAVGKKKGEHPSPATVMCMLREHDEQAEAARYADDDFPFRPIPARVTGPGSGIDPALMERLQSQARPQ